MHDHRGNPPCPSAARCSSPPRSCLCWRSPDARSTPSITSRRIRPTCASSTSCRTAGIDVQVNGPPAFGTSRSRRDRLPELREQGHDVHRQGDGSETVRSIQSPSLVTSRTRWWSTGVGESLLTMLSEVGNAPTNGNIQLSVFNAAINHGWVDIYVTPPGVDITMVNPNFGSVLNGTRRSTCRFRQAPTRFGSPRHQERHLRLRRHGAHAQHRAVVDHLFAGQRRSGQCVVSAKAGRGRTLDNVFARSRT